MISTSRHNLAKLICLALALCLIFLTGWYDVSRMNNVAQTQMSEQANDFIAYSSHYIRLYFKSLMRIAEDITPFISLNDDITDQSVMRAITDISSTSAAYDIVVSRADGSYVDSRGNTGKMSPEQYAWLLQGETSRISSVNNLMPEGESRVIISTQVERDGDIIGVLSGIYDPDSLTAALNTSYYWDAGYFHVFQPDGSFVLRSPSTTDTGTIDSVFSMDGLNLIGEKELTAFKNDLTAGKSGSISYTSSEGEQFIGYYAPVGINDWFIMAIISESAVHRFASDSISVLVLGLAKLFIIVAALIFMLARLQHERDKNVNAQIDELQTINSKRGIALENLGVPPFEFDMQSLEAHPLSPDCSTYSWFIERILSPDHSDEIVHHDDESAYLKLCDALFSAKGMLSGDFRLKLTPYAPYCLYRLILSVPEYTQDKPHTIVTLINLEDVGRRTESLRLRAACDELTGLDTRSEMRIKSAALLSRTNHHFGAVVLIAADNFDAVCDANPDIPRAGLINDCAKAITATLSECDVFSRGVGCEFWVFSGDATCAEIIQKGISKLFEAKIVPGDQLTFSCGMAHADPEDSIDDLLERAYKAACVAHRDGGRRLQHG